MSDSISQNDDMLNGVSVDVRVCVGFARPTIGELMQLSPDSVLELSAKVEDPVDLFIGDRLIGKGFLEEAEEEAGGLTVRLTAVGEPNRGK